MDGWRCPFTAGKWLGCTVDRAGRVRIQPDLTVPDHPNIFVVGDTASLDQDGKPLPGVAQVAMQQGRYAAKSIFRKVIGHPPLPRFAISIRAIWPLSQELRSVQSAGVQLVAIWRGLSGPDTHSIPGREQLEVQCLYAVVLDLSDWQTRCRLIIRSRSGG